MLTPSQAPVRLPGPGQTEWAPTYDHTTYSRIWKLKRRGGQALVTPGGSLVGYVETKGRQLKLYRPDGRRFA